MTKSPVCEACKGTGDGPPGRTLEGDMHEMPCPICKGQGSTPATILEQIARDISNGGFPKKSEKTLQEEAIIRIVMESVAAGAPGISELIREGIARSIAMKVVSLSSHHCNTTGE